MSSTGELQRVGARVTSAGLDERHNRVTVTVQGDIVAARTALARWSSAIQVQPGAVAPAACVERYNCFPPLRGGLVIESNDFSTRCTSGFVAYKAAQPLDPSTTPAEDAVIADYFLLSAGHCDAEHDGLVWEHADQIVGQMTINTWEGPEMDLDVSAIPIADDYAANWVYVRSTSNPYPVRAAQPVGQDQVDDSVCISVPYVEPPAIGGWREGAKCGFISEVEQTIVTCVTGEPDPLCESFYQLSDQTIVEMLDQPAVRPGDSGGPVFSNAPNTARGIVHGFIQDPFGGATDKFVYGQIGHLFDSTSPGPGDFGLRVLTKPALGGGTP